MALDLDWVAAVQANTSAIERRAASIGGRRTVKKDYQAAWLCKAVSLIDLTTLSGDDTWGRVERLCAKARQPVLHYEHTEMGFNYRLTELQAALGTSQANISRQLKVLHEAGLLSRERRGAQVFYAISEPLVMDICEAACRKLNRETGSGGAKALSFRA